MLDVFRDGGAVAEGFAYLLRFGGVLDEFEVGEAVGFNDLVDEDIAGIVVLLPRPVLDLLDVAVALVFGAEADGDGAVEEVDELGAAGEAVLGHDLVAVDLWGVGQDDEGEAEGFLELDEALHEFGGGGGFLGVAGDEGDVVDEDLLDSEFGCFLNALEDGLVHVGAVDVFGADLGAEEVVREDVADAQVRVGIAELELLVGEFAVDVEDRFVAGDLLGELGGEDGFPGVGDRKEDDVLVLDDEVVAEEPGVRAREGLLYPLVGGLDGEGADLDGETAGFPALLLEGLDRVFH